jgi:hypothetical protein
VADVLTGGRLAGGVGDTTRVLVGMRRSLARNSAGRSGTQLAGAGIGTILAVGTLLLGLVRFDDQGRSVDLLAALLLGWLIGWSPSAAAVRGCDPSGSRCCRSRRAAWPPGCSVRPSWRSRR